MKDTTKDTASVLVVMGSASDLDKMEGALDILKELGVGYEVTITSAHRTPERTKQLVASAEERGVQVIIAGAGAAAHLAGVIASHTVMPVIGVPVDSSPLSGLDALLSTCQMPSGIPVATMAIGSAGAKNAGLFACQILAAQDAELRVRLLLHRRQMEEKLLKSAAEVEQKYNQK